MTATSSAADKLALFVRDAKASSYVGCTYESWTDVDWHIRPHEALAHQQKGDCRVRFVRHYATRGWKKVRRGGEPFDEPFASFARAVFVARVSQGPKGESRSTYHGILVALRALYECLPASARRPDLLTPGRFDDAVEFLTANGLSQQSAVVIACRLEWIAKLIDNKRLTPTPLRWVRTVRVDRDAPFKREAVEAKIGKRLLIERQLDRWAELSKDPPAKTYDLIRQRAVDLMLCGGFRVNEVVALPADTLFREERRDENGDAVLDADGGRTYRWGLRYWPSKCEDNAPFVKVIPTAMVPIVLRAVRDIEAATVEARATALALAEGRNPFEDHPIYRRAKLSGVLGCKEIGALFGCPTNTGRTFIRKHAKSKSTAGRRSVISVEAFDEAVKSTFSFVSEFNNGCIALHKCLFVVPKRYAPGTSTLLSTASVMEYLIKFYSSKYNDNILDFDSKTTTPLSHDFRYYINTLALDAGLSDLDLAAWMGRQNVAANRHYDLRQPGARAASLGDVIYDKDDATALSRIRVAPSFDVDIEPGRTGQVTALGYCHADYAEAPCDFYRAHVVTATDLLVPLRGYLSDYDVSGISNRVARLRADAQAAVNRGVVGAERWLEHLTDAERVLTDPSGVLRERQRSWKTWGMGVSSGGGENSSLGAEPNLAEGDWDEEDLG